MTSARKSGNKAQKGEGKQEKKAGTSKKSGSSRVRERHYCVTVQAGNLTPLPIEILDSLIPFGASAFTASCAVWGHYLSYWNGLPDFHADVRFVSFQMEAAPETKQWHCQMYIECKNQTSRSRLNEILNTKDVHVEARAGTRLQARDYCLKEDSRLSQDLVAKNAQDEFYFDVGPFQAGRWLEQNGEYGSASASYVETAQLAAKQEAQDKAVRAQARALRKLSRFNDNRGLASMDLGGNEEHEDFPADQQSSDEEMLDVESKVQTLSGSCMMCKAKVEYNPEWQKPESLTCSDNCFLSAYNDEVFADDPLEKLQANKRTFDTDVACPACGTKTLFHKASCRAISVSNLREATLHLLSKKE